MNDTTLGALHKRLDAVKVRVFVTCSGKVLILKEGKA